MDIIPIVTTVEISNLGNAGFFENAVYQEVPEDSGLLDTSTSCTIIILI